MGQVLVFVLSEDVRHPNTYIHRIPPQIARATGHCKKQEFVTSKGAGSSIKSTEDPGRTRAQEGLCWEMSGGTRAWQRQAPAECMGDPLFSLG